MTLRQGGVVLPLTASTANSLLRDADPALFHVLDFVRYLLRTNLEARLAAESLVCGAEITAAVRTAIPFDPSPYLTADQIQFPLLAIYRQSAESESRTQAWTTSVSTLNIDYVLPPLSAGQAERILPILHACSALMARSIQLGADPGYAPQGGVLGQPVWQFAGIEKIDLGSEKYGVWTDGGELVFHAWSAQLRLSERTTYSHGFPGSVSSQDYQPLGDVNIHEDITDSESGTVVPDIVVIRTIP